MTNKTEFIAEIGNNHNGSVDRAYRLIDAAKQAGAQVAKFQLRDFGSLYRVTENNVEDLGVEYIKDLLKKYEISLEQHYRLAEYCSKIDIEYMCTPWDIKSISILENIGVKRYKIASADFDNLPLIEELLATRKPLIFSTGMSFDKEIKSRIAWLNERDADFTILHCNSTYPAPFDDIELSYISRLKELTEKVGYSGHERGIGISIAAVALGASLIERHITEDKLLEGPDHQASLTPAEFATMVGMAREVSHALPLKNGKSKTLSQGALLNRENLGKSIIAAIDLDVGHVIESENLDIRSPGQGMAPSELKNVVGKTLQKPLYKHEFLTTSHFEKQISSSKITMGSLLWGVPVRPHDVFEMHATFDAKVYEFHISYKDLFRPFPDKDWEILKNRQILVHAPELFGESQLLDLTDQENIAMQTTNLNLVCEFARRLKSKIKYNKDVNIITNIGGFSTHGFRPDFEKPSLYEQVAKNLEEIDERGCNIIIQNMAPFPWHFGGQRYQNIFVFPEEIISFCKQEKRKITLDTSHLSMFCAYSNRDFIEEFYKLLPYVAHFHIADAAGNNGEGVKLGTGDINFKPVIDALKPEQTFIVETWQGHKEFGKGFMEDLRYLSSMLN